LENNVSTDISDAVIQKQQTVSSEFKLPENSNIYASEYSLYLPDKEVLLQQEEKPKQTVCFYQKNEKPDSFSSSTRGKTKANCLLLSKNEKPDSLHEVVVSKRLCRSGSPLNHH